MRRSLTEDEVVGVLTDNDAGMSAIAIAAKYGTSRETVYGIVTGRTHRDVVARWEADHDGTTEAELDAMIAEQYASMPNGPRIEPQRDRLPASLARGRGVRASSRLQRG
jgi:hypothetical protein